MNQRKLKLKNPQKLNTSYHMLSGEIISIRYLADWPDEYLYSIKSNNGKAHKFRISKTLIDDLIDIKIDIYDLTSFQIRRHIDFVKEKREFTDYLIKQYETEVLNNPNI